MIRYLLDWIREDIRDGQESVLAFIGMCMVVLLVMLALIVPAVFSARDAANEMEAAHKRGEYTTVGEERELQNKLIRAQIEWYDSNHKAEKE